MSSTYHIGDWVVYRKTKHSPKPGPRAQLIHAAPKGEDYTYEVDKYWIVADASDPAHLLLRTRRGKDNIVNSQDPNLRHARLWEKLLKRHRFPATVNPQPTTETK